MSDNLKIWNTLATTNPQHTKGFQRSGGFKGTAVKPIYCDQRMTDLFGPCGEGWGINKPEFQLVPADKEILVYCTVSIWHGKPGNLVYGVGGDKVVSAGNSGTRTSDEAFKMAFTDAIGNAYKRLGMSADIHMGMFDDFKYVADLKEEFAETKGHDAKATAKAAKPPEDDAAMKQKWLDWIAKLKAAVTDAPTVLSALEIENKQHQRMDELRQFNPEWHAALRHQLDQIVKVKPAEAA